MSKKTAIYQKFMISSFPGWENQNELYFQNDPYVYFEYLKQNEYAPLHEAAYYGKLKKVAEFLKNGKYHVNEKDLNESTPLHDAVTQGKSSKFRENDKSLISRKNYSLAHKTTDRDRSTKMAKMISRKNRILHF